MAKLDLWCMMESDMRAAGCSAVNIIDINMEYVLHSVNQYHTVDYTTKGVVTKLADHI